MFPSQPRSLGKECAHIQENRGAHRSALFLMASIEGGRHVRIRNLSETGALLEGDILPPVGATITVTRLEVSAVADVVWVGTGQCGVNVQGRIAVPEWIGGRPGVPLAGQARVDAIQAAARSGMPGSDIKQEQGSAGLDQDLEERMAQEILFVQRLVDGIASDLICDPAIVHRYPQALQGFEIADKILGHLARILSASDREAAVKAVGMEELLARLLGKSIGQ